MGITSKTGLTSDKQECCVLDFWTDAIVDLKPNDDMKLKASIWDKNMRSNDAYEASWAFDALHHLMYAKFRPGNPVPRV